MIRTVLNAAGMHLAQRANFALTLAFKSRHEETNWGRMLDAKNQLMGFKRDPHPLIRKLAYDAETLTNPPEPEAA